MFIHLPNPSKRRATGSLLTPGAQGGGCSKIINSNACFSIFPLKFQGLSTPPPNSSMQNQAASFKTPCCQACWFFFAVREAKRPGTHLASPPAFLLTPEKDAQVNQHQPGGPGGTLFPCISPFPGESSMLCKRELGNLHHGQGTCIKTGSLLRHELNLGRCILLGCMLHPNNLIEGSLLWGT